MSSVTGTTESDTETGNSDKKYPLKTHLAAKEGKGKKGTPEFGGPIGDIGNLRAVLLGARTATTNLRSKVDLLNELLHVSVVTATARASTELHLQLKKGKPTIRRSRMKTEEKEVGRRYG